MVFSTPIFIFLFLPLFLIFYFCIPSLKEKESGVSKKNRNRNAVLFLFSILFYALGELRYVPLLLFSVCLNYATGLLLQKLDSPRREAPRRSVFIIALCINVGFLLFFKYNILTTCLMNTDFSIGVLNNFLEMLGVDKTVSAFKIFLPLGISFYTFQALSYIIDVYRRRIPATWRFIDFGAYLTMFPQLIAGPIVRYESIAAELIGRKTRIDTFLAGCTTFVRGLAKKVLIADILALPAAQIFALSTGDLTAPVAWFGALCYTMQIYFDFSGYSDMAIGMGKMLGFTFPVNFRYPYISTSIREFWQRWHISLSTWFRDYVYIPLGGNRQSVRTTYLNLLFVFFLCAVWHGAEWTFIIWGLMHGFFIVLERIGLEVLLKKLPRPLQHAYVLLVVVVAWVFFRADSPQHALSFLSAMFWLSDSSGSVVYLERFINNEVTAFFCIGVICCLPVRKILSDFKATAFFHSYARTVLYFCLYFYCLMAMSLSSYSPFLYFRF